MIKRSIGIQDAGAPLVVDPFTRKVTVPATERVIGVVGDHCSEQVRFSLPQSIDNHDMTTCTHSYVSWRNVEGTDGTDELVITETANDHILFGWVVRDAITVAKGLVSFSLNFECWEKDEKTGKEKLIYKWGTYTCTECEILDSLNTKMGAFEAICIDGETLVFKDYTPVREETLALRSGIIPEGTLEITEAGRHDVGRYAYADVKAIFEEPTITIADGKVTAEANGMTKEEPLEPIGITIADGKVTAEANGLTSERGLEAPVLIPSTGKITATANGLTTEQRIWANEYCKRTRVSITHPGTGYFSYEDIDPSDNALKMTSRALDASTDNPIELNLVTGGTLYFTTATNTAASVTVEGHLTAVMGTLKSVLGIEMTNVHVPAVDEGIVVNITMH